MQRSQETTVNNYITNKVHNLAEMDRFLKIMLPAKMESRRNRKSEKTNE